MFGFGSFTDVVWWITGNWFAFKIYVEHDLAINDGLVHMAAGLGLQGALCLLFRTSLANPLPWIAILLFETANEANDLYWVWRSDEGTAVETAKDMLLTMLLPTIALLVVRSRQQSQEMEA